MSGASGRQLFHATLDYNNNTKRKTGKTMYYFRWTQCDLETLRMHALYTEIDADGWVQREVGIAENGAIIHQAPSVAGERGLFDLARIATEILRSNISEAEFESLWETAEFGQLQGQ